MNFVESVNSALLENYAKFKGRAPRAEYWYFLLFTILLSLFSVVFFFIFLFSAGGGFDAEYVTKLSDPRFCENDPSPVQCAENASILVITHYFEETNLTNYLYISLIFSFALFLPSFSVLVRRLQDLDRSFYFAGPYLFVAIFNVYLSILMAQDPLIFLFETLNDGLIGALSNISLIIIIFYFLWFLQPGQYDENRFGPNKLEEKFDDTY